mmetsp:Transcript_81523/g.227043  ORF Transcript_81523/g.227043 Transcript_81523/m.227043 type:complete len:215 (+) Transcript_81523:833-1477(+)
MHNGFQQSSFVDEDPFEKVASLTPRRWARGEVATIIQPQFQHAPQHRSSMLATGQLSVEPRECLARAAAAAKEMALAVGPLFERLLENARPSATATGRHHDALPRRADGCTGAPRWCKNGVPYARVHSWRRAATIARRGPTFGLAPWTEIGESMESALADESHVAATAATFFHPIASFPQAPTPAQCGVPSQGAIAQGVNEQPPLLFEKGIRGR